MKKRILASGLCILITITSMFCQELVTQNLADSVASFIIEKTNGVLYRNEQGLEWGDQKIYIQLDDIYSFDSIKSVVEEAFEGIDNSEIITNWSHNNTFSRILYSYGELNEGFIISVDFIKEPLINTYGIETTSEKSFFVIIVV